MKRIYKIIIEVLFCIGMLQNVTLAQTISEKIRINQVGFFCDGLKKAVAVDFTENTFEIWKSDLSEKMYSGVLIKSPVWYASGEENIKIANFSSFAREGNYVIVIGSSKSFPFVISRNALDTVAKSQMKYYYFNRSSTALPSQYAGKWARSGGHFNKQVIPFENKTRIISMPGGWYDAGDYGLYMVTGSMAVCQILMSYEQFPEYWNKTEWNIPESGNGVPDILDEVKWELKWMYAMKDTDNGVWYKATSKDFPGFLMPNKETSDIYCMVKNATSAYDYAATFAFAARVFNKYTTQYPGFADSCLTAAKAAWSWGVANEKTKAICVNPKGVYTGEYGDSIAGNGNDNKVLAGVEMFITTGDSAYLKPILSSAKNGFVTGEANWYEKRPVATMQLALHGNKDALNEVIKYAEGQVNDQNTNGYNVNIGKYKYEFNWGSNRRISNRGMAMMVAYILTKDRKYLDGVSNSMDYILGRNATSYCFISGFGTKQVMKPHHRISGSDEIPEPQPGLPIQGPYYGNMGQCSPNIISVFAAKNYIDSECSYSSNELSIDQGSPNVFNLGGLNQYLGKSLSVEITSPLNNEIIGKSADLVIKANVTKNDDSITHVDFYQNNQLICTSDKYPYGCTLIAPTDITFPDSENELTAIAYNTKNDSSISKIKFFVGNASPRVSIEEPRQNSVFAAQQSVTLNTSAFDLDGKISKLEYYLNGSLIHTCTDSPFVYTIPSIPEGVFTIQAKAYDNKNATNTSEIKISANCNNLIQNSEFNDGLNSWILLNTSPAKGSYTSSAPGISGDKALKISVLTKGKLSSQIQLQQPLPVKKGQTYYISYLAKADTTCVIECNVQHESDAWDPWIKYITSIDTIKSYPQLYSHTFIASDDDDGSKLKFFLGTTALTNVYLDKVEVSLCPFQTNEIKTLSFSKHENIVKINTTTALPLVLKNNDGMNLQVYPLTGVILTSSDTTIVSIDATGKIKAKALGTVTISASLASNNSIHDEIVITVSSLVDLSEQFQLGVVVKPTITKDIISVSADEDISLIQVYSASGIVQKTITCNAKQLSISIAELSSAQYFLKLTTSDNKIAVVKIIKL